MILMSKVIGFIQYIKRMVTKKPIFMSYLVIILLLGIFVTPRIYAQLQPTKSVEIFSEKLNYNKKEPGAWKVTKSAKWIRKGIAEITFDVESIVKTDYDNYDVLFVLDISGSMSGSRLDKVKSDTIDVINELLSNDKNRAGLITFETNSTIVNDFTNNKSELIDSISHLNVNGNTNYYQALVNVDTVLRNYKKEDNKECIVLFLTDGYPNEETPNEIIQYDYLKNKYPFVTINGVQYEMGNTILDPIKKVSDNQFFADMNTLNNVLFEASISPIKYDNFEIIDYIDDEYFYIDDEKNIVVNQGNIIFDKDNQKVKWNIDNFKSGNKAAMSIKVKQKSKYIEEGGFYSTNNKETVYSKIDGIIDEIDTSKTPVLSNKYKVIYDSNEPFGCNVTDVPDEEEHLVSDTIELSDNVLKCNGYQFKGWDIVTNDVEKINSDYFTMPEKDVLIKAKWGKVGISKSMNGTVNERTTLYKQIKADATDSSKYVKEYTGDTSTFKGKDKIYYYYGAAENNNVIFGDYCWKIVRTTDTGGVKLLYNGLPIGGQCNNSGSNSVLTNNEIGESLLDSSNSIAFNPKKVSLADSGYMYNKRYDYQSRRLDWQDSVLSYKSMSTDERYSYYYSDSFQYDGSKYTLVDGKKIDWKNNSPDSYVGKYSLFSSSDIDGGNYLYYVARVDYNEIFYILLSKGETEEDIISKSMITLGDDVSEDNGVYTLINPVVVDKRDWKDNYRLYKDKYTCNSMETSCSEMLYITNAYDNNMNYVYVKNNFKYGNSFVWDGENYTLTDTVDILDWDKMSSLVEKHHYTCFNNSGTCSELYYIYHNVFSIRYIALNGGKSMEDAMNEMLYNDETNTIDSNVKRAIDTWYRNNMLIYTPYLQDTVWCNDRSFENLPKTGWNPNGGSLLTDIDFSNSSSNLSCVNKNDRFTVSSDNGNGALTYPTALLTGQEANLAYDSNSNPKSFIHSTFTLTPSSYGVTNSDDLFRRYVDKVGKVWSTSGDTEIRPAISLRPDIKYKSGNGSASNPYLIDLENEFKISINDERVYVNDYFALSGKKVKLLSKDSNFIIESFKVNGKLITNDYFIMPEEDVEITDIVLLNQAIVESAHNPYLNKLNEEHEKTFEGANSLTVSLDYQTESTSYGWIYLYDSTGKQYGKYGGTTMKNVTITIPGDYVKIVFRTDGSGNNYYGYKATITPNY